MPLTLVHGPALPQLPPKPLQAGTQDVPTQVRGLYGPQSQTPVTSLLRHLGWPTVSLAPGTGKKGPPH